MTNKNDDDADDEPDPDYRVHRVIEFPQSAHERAVAAQRRLSAARARMKAKFATSPVMSPQARQGFRELMLLNLGARLANSDLDLEIAVGVSDADRAVIEQGYVEAKLFEQAQREPKPEPKRSWYERLKTLLRRK